MVLVTENCCFCIHPLHKLSVYIKVDSHSAQGNINKKSVPLSHDYFITQFNMTLNISYTY